MSMTMGFRKLMKPVINNVICASKKPIGVREITEQVTPPVSTNFVRHIVNELLADGIVFKHGNGQKYRKYHNIEPVYEQVLIQPATQPAAQEPAKQAADDAVEAVSNHPADIMNMFLVICKRLDDISKKLDAMQGDQRTGLDGRKYTGSLLS